MIRESEPVAESIMSMAESQVDMELSQAKQKDQPKAIRFVTNYGAPHPKR